MSYFLFETNLSKQICGGWTFEGQQSFVGVKSGSWERITSRMPKWAWVRVVGWMEGVELLTRRENSLSCSLELKKSNFHRQNVKSRLHVSFVNIWSLPEQYSSTHSPLLECVSSSTIERELPAAKLNLINHKITIVKATGCLKSTIETYCSN